MNNNIAVAVPLLFSFLFVQTYNNSVNKCTYYVKTPFHMIKKKKRCT